MNRTLLLVEDDENDVFFVRRALKNAGIERLLQVVPDGQQALDYLKGEGKFTDRAAHAFPSLILLDLKIPLISGLEVLRWLRSQPELPPVIVLVLTSSRQPADVAEAYRLGTNAYLVKPLDPKKLGEMFSAVRQFWFDVAELPPRAD